MTTKFDVGEEVYLKATVCNISISADGTIKYTLVVPEVARKLSARESIIVKKEVADGN